MSELFAGQRKDELFPFVDWLKTQDIRSILEVGSRDGEVLRYMVEQTGASTAVSVDLPGAAWGNSNKLPCLRANVKQMNGTLIIGDSHDPTIVQQALDLGPFDLIFIDADHTYDGVRQDYLNYGPHGRLVALHDVSTYRTESQRARPPTAKIHRVGVPQLWGELTSSYPHKEFIGPQSHFGIGVLL